MVDTSMISYGYSNESLEKILSDETCRKIYNDVVEVYKSFNVFEQIESQMLQLLAKYSLHYLSLYFIGNLYNEHKIYDYAHSAYLKCIEKYPLVDAYLNLSILYQQTGNQQKLKELLNEAILRGIDDVRVQNFLGVIYYADKDYYKAIEHFENIVTKYPESSLKNIYNNLGFACTAVCKLTKSLEYFEKGLQIQPDKSILSPESITSINTQLLQNKLLAYDYMFNLPEDTFKDYLRINDILQTNHICSRKLGNGEPIRVGFVSPDLRMHVCAHFLQPIFANYDKTKFKYYCYAEVRNEDSVSEKIKSLVDYWFNIFKLPTQQVCNLIHSHNIDILIDLAGHTNNNRLDVFAKKCAPIQMTYLGYPNTTGLTNVDYRICDSFTDPIDTHQQYSEKLLRLPKCFICYHNHIDLSTLPIIIKKRTGVVFGVTNKSNKQNKDCIRLWSNILNKVPNSVLCIKYDLKCGEQKLIKKFTSFGVSEKQIKLHNHIKDEHEYFELYNNIDICLDTSYSGTTTSCATLLMSCPIVTLNMKNRHVANVTTSFLMNMDLPELIAHSEQEYVDIAVNLANNKNKIVEYKNTIREKFLNLMNEKRFASEFDELLLDTFNKHKQL